MIPGTRGIEYRVAVGFAVVVVAAAIIAWLVYSNITRLHDDREAMTNTQNALSAMDDVIFDLQNIETGYRGYVITGRPDFLGPFNDGAGLVDADITRVLAFTVADVAQQQRLSDLRLLAAVKIEFGRQAIDKRDTAGQQAAAEFVASGGGAATMKEAVSLVRTMPRAEEERLQDRTSRSDVSIRNSAVLTIALAVVSLAFIGMLLVALVRGLASQGRAAEANQRLGAILGASSDAIISVDLDGRITSWNRGAERIFGHSAGEIVGKEISVICLPDQIAQQEANLAAARAGQEVVDQETVRLAKDGRNVDVSVSAFPLRSASGKVTGIAGVFRDITERKQVETSLRDWQQRFATMFNVSPVGMSLTRLSDGAFLDINSRFLELFGFAREEVTGRTILNLGIWPDPARRSAVLDRITAEGSVRDVEMPWRTNSGRIIHTITSWELLDLGGEPHVLSLISDITDRKEAEEERERVFALSSDLIAVTGFDGLFRRVNPAATEILGYSVDEILARPFLDILHPDDRPVALGELSRLQVGERSVTFEGRAQAKDGSYRWVELEASADLESQRIFAVARDVTRRREIEEALRASEERFRSIVETATDAIVVADAAGLIEVFNPAAERMFGYATAEVLGQNVNALVPFPGSEVVGLPGEMVGQRKDGTTFPHELTVNPMRIGTEIKFTAIIRDMTSRKEMEDELRAAKEAAEEANRAKSAFLSRMSHELRTPLNVVLGFGQVLQLDPLDPPQAEAVDYIIKAGRHLLELIDEVLDISRIEAGRLSLSIEPVRADELLSETLALMRPLAEQRRVTVNSDFDSCTAFILADRQRLKQVLLNLFSNAIKYNREGGSVTIACRSMGDSALRIMVTDTGLGIAPEQLDRVFSPFDRLGAEATGVEGTGLGLTLSRHLVEAMGGAIGVESAVGTGSTFWVELPLGAPPDGPETKAEATAQPESNRITGGRSILYVEDNLANLKLMERVLTQQKGFHLIAAMQGRLGIELARDHRPDLILLDLHLPDMLGSDVLRELKSHPGTVDIPVVIISADASPGLAARLLDAGARAYLTKPLALKEFLELTDSILREES